VSYSTYITDKLKATFGTNIEVKNGYGSKDWTAIPLSL